MTKSITTIGCDIGDKTTDICVLQGDGGKQQFFKERTTKKSLGKFFDRPASRVVLEVGAHSRWISEMLEEKGHEVVVANARRLDLISKSDSKSDRKDCELLARLGRVDVELLAPVKHRNRQAQEDLAVAKARDVLVSARTKLINHVRGVLKSEGLILLKCDADYFVKKTEGLIPTALGPALTPVYETLKTIDAQIDTHDQAIEDIAKQRYGKEMQALTAVSGVATLTALVFILTLEDESRFASSRMAGAFLGLRPRRSQSGDDDPQLGITKAGDPFARRLLVNAANYILGPFAKDSDLRRWGLKLAERGGKNARKRAKIAVARKLAVLLHRLWVTGEVYEPVGYQARRPEKPATTAAAA
jgi:transposase